MKTNENRMFERKEIFANVSFEKSTPNKQDVKNAVCLKIGANPETAVIRKISSKFGSKNMGALLYVYSNKEAALATEPNYILVRNGMAEKKLKKEKKKVQTKKVKR